MEEDIKIQDLIEHIRFGTQLKYDMKTYLIAIENLLLKYKELEELEDITYETLKDTNFIHKNYIPKSKVKEKIEELNKCLSDTNVIMISILESLLED